jgi:hypothetical protein
LRTVLYCDKLTGGVPPRTEMTGLSRQRGGWSNKQPKRGRYWVEIKVKHVVAPAHDVAKAAALAASKRRLSPAVPYDDFVEILPCEAGQGGEEVDLKAEAKEVGVVELRHDNAGAVDAKDGERLLFDGETR